MVLSRSMLRAMRMILRRPSLSARGARITAPTPMPSRAADKSQPNWLADKPNSSVTALAENAIATRS